MAPGPKKKSFHTPRNPKNSQITKNNDKKNIESNNEVDKSSDITSSFLADSDTPDRKKYSKRSLESNWMKYEEPQTDPHAESARGNNFDVLLSYSGGSGSQVKLQDEKEWEDETLNMKELSLNLQELINSLKCIPFHERIGVQNIFDEKHILNFISSAEKWKISYKSPQSKPPNSEAKNLETAANIDLNLIEEPDFLQPDDCAPVKIVVQDKTENIINSLASNLSFKKFTEKEEQDEKKLAAPCAEEKNSETTSSDLDFLLSLNISSKLSVKEAAPKNANVDDWLNSILDD